jgi:hypothetical protein
MTIELNEVNKSLSDNYLLVEVSLSGWSPRRSAKELAREAERQHGAVTGAVSSTKNLLAGVDSDLDELKAAQNKIRSYAYEKTLPFGKAEGKTKKGPRLLPVIQAPTFMAEIDKLIRIYDQAYQNFMASYPNARLAAVNNLNGLATLDEYPEPEEMAGRFAASVTYGTVPNVRSFESMSLPSDIVEALSDKMAERQTASMKVGMEDLRERIGEQLTRTIKQLTKVRSGERTSIFSSMQTSIQNLAGLLESSIPLLGESEKIHELHEKLKELGKITPDSYKTSQQALDKGEALALEASKLLAGLGESESVPEVQSATQAGPSLPTPPAVPQKPPVLSAESVEEVLTSSEGDLDSLLASLEDCL